MTQKKVVAEAMENILLMTVRFHDGRYHGTGDWPPSPARLFQALIAGAAQNGELTEAARYALIWLANDLSPPIIAAPPVRNGQSIKTFVPNNDLDAEGGDPRRIGNIRTDKTLQPRLFDNDLPLLYAWNFEPGGESNRNAKVLCNMAEQLYQLGRGVDMAWGWGEVIDEKVFKFRLAQHGGSLYRPAYGSQGILLDCPAAGSLESLEARYAAERQRFNRSVDGKKVSVFFSRAPKPHFQPIAYNCPPFRRLFELRTMSPDAPFAPWPQERICTLVEQIRDAAVSRLWEALPGKKSLVERVLIGRNATEADKSARVRITPLPSIGHFHVDRSIRRVLVEVPTDCPIGSEDIAWAFSGLVVGNAAEEHEETRLVRASDLGMLIRFGMGSGEPSRLWRTVTPAALPERAARRRIDPHRIREEAKSGSERFTEIEQASAAVLQALRHAGVQGTINTIRVQREPFSTKGAQAVAFAPGTRFAKERLWHVEISFAEPIEGPLVIGDGRYIGLGLMEPIRRSVGVFSFAIVGGLNSSVDPIELAKTLRRAVMARAQEQLGSRSPLPGFFTGHASTGEPLREGNHGHLAFAADMGSSRLLVIAPHLLENRPPTHSERTHLELLDAALEGLVELRAGAAGCLKLAPNFIDIQDDPLFAPAQTWESCTEYRPTRHYKRVSAAGALMADALREVRGRGMATPEIEVLEVREGPRGGLSGRLRLHFQVAQAGPILIGHTRHYGGGLFLPVATVEAS